MIELNPLERKNVNRLSDKTRTLATQYLSGQFRKELQMPDFSIDDLDLPDNISPIDRQASSAYFPPRGENSRIGSAYPGNDASGSRHERTLLHQPHHR